MRISLAYYDNKLTITPLAKRERFPEPIRLYEKEGVTYIAPTTLFNHPIPIGTIPEHYRLISKDKYQLLFVTSTPPKRTPKPKFKNSLLKQIQ